MILRNKTNHMALLNGKLVRKWRTIMVPEELEYDTQVFEEVEKKSKPIKIKQIKSVKEEK